jgi:hypothetical protein
MRWMIEPFNWAVIAWLLCPAALVSSQREVTVRKVGTAKEFKAALDEGFPFLHITNHLDLTYPPETVPDTLFEGAKFLRSVTVRTNPFE